MGEQEKDFRAPAAGSALPGEDAEAIAARICNTHNPHNGAGEPCVSWCLCDVAAAALRAYGARVRAEALRCPDCGGSMTPSCDSEQCILKAFNAAPPLPDDEPEASAAQPPPEASKK